MADRIDSISKSDNHWTICYTVEKNSQTNSFSVMVDKSDMTDSDSDVEARSLANVKAAIVKDRWVAEALPTVLPVVSEPENVTLEQPL